MIKKVKQTIEKYNLLDKGDGVVVALSGGPDSTALLVILTQIAEEIGFNLIAAHINHGLRGEESNEDEKYSRELSEKMGVAFVAHKIDKTGVAKGVSPEDYYRRQRYSFLNKVAQEQRAKKIALGHNLQDQAETVLLNLLRGSGLEGLKGILPMRDGKFIRPLIEVSRREIISFLNAAGIQYRQDSSNESKQYLRNKIRGELIPYIKEKFNPKIEENLAQTAEILRNEDEFIRQYVLEAIDSPYIQRKKNLISLNITYINKLPQAIRLRSFKALLESLNPEKNGFSFIHIKSLENLAQRKVSGKRISLPADIAARREYDNLILERKKASPKHKEYEYTMKIPGSINIQARNRTIRLQTTNRDYIDWGSENKVYMDLEKISLPLILRNRRDGDWFQPLGMKGRKKIKTFFIDRKIPRNERDEIMLIADQISVVWIEKMHLNDRVKITKETKNVLELESIDS
jgi:tRNA(Ile)-lysidine synthase